jgi:hypothetical protein
LTARWRFGNGSELVLLANLGASAISGLTLSASQIIYSSEGVDTSALMKGKLPPWSVAWFQES